MLRNVPAVILGACRVALLLGAGCTSGYHQSVPVSTPEEATTAEALMQHLRAQYPAPGERRFSPMPTFFPTSRIPVQ